MFRLGLAFLFAVGILVAFVTREVSMGPAITCATMPPGRRISREYSIRGGQVIHLSSGVANCKVNNSRSRLMKSLQLLAFFIKAFGREGAKPVNKLCLSID